MLFFSLYSNFTVTGLTGVADHKKLPKMLCGILCNHIYVMKRHKSTRDASRYWYDINGVEITVLWNSKGKSIVCIQKLRWFKSWRKSQSVRWFSNYSLQNFRRSLIYIYWNYMQKLVYWLGLGWLHSIENCCVLFLNKIFRSHFYTETRSKFCWLNVDEQWTEIHSNFKPVCDTEILWNE